MVGWIQLGILIVRVIFLLPSLISMIKDISALIHAIKDPIEQAQARQGFATTLNEAVAMKARGQGKECRPHLQRYLERLHARHPQSAA